MHILTTRGAQGVQCTHSTCYEQHAIGLQRGLLRVACHRLAQQLEQPAPMHAHMQTCKHAHTHRCTDAQMHRCTDAHMRIHARAAHGQMDRWADGQMAPPQQVARGLVPLGRPGGEPCEGPACVGRQVGTRAVPSERRTETLRTARLPAWRRQYKAPRTACHE